MDIEGTTSSIEFVYDILFPYARANLLSYLEEHLSDDETWSAIETIGKDLGYSKVDDWVGKVFKDEKKKHPSLLKIICEQVNKMMDEDIKATGLKKLQGLIWDVGYKNGTLSSHVYDDVPTALKAWKDIGKDLRIYSSGSVHAQKIFFKHTAYGALGDHFSAHYDTNIGAKKDTDSYIAIARDAGLAPDKILFLSDTPAELDAAKGAGMEVCLVCRPDNNSKLSYIPAIESFLQIKL